MKLNSCLIIRCIRTLKMILSILVPCGFILCSSGCQKSLLNALSHVDSPAQKGITAQYDYSVYFSYKDSAAVGYIGQVYTDSAFFDLRINLNPDSANPAATRATASVSNTRHYRPTVIPLSETYPEPGGITVTWTWIPDTVGVYNIDSVFIDNSPIGDDQLVVLNFVNGYGLIPGYSGLELPSGIPALVPSRELLPGDVVNPVQPFKISREVQSLGDPAKGFYFLITPKNQ